MLFIKILFSALIISLVKGLPINEDKTNTRRPNLDTYKYNHPPSIAIPVSVVFEDDKSGKDVKISGDTKSVNSPELSSAYPVSVVFEQNISKSDKSRNPEKINSARSDKQSAQSEKLSPIPVSVVIEKESQSSERVGKSDNQNPEKNDKPPTTSKEQSAEAIPVAVVFQEEVKQNQIELKSKKVDTDDGNNKILPKEIQKDEKDAEPTILTSTEPITSNSDIEIPTRSSVEQSYSEQKDEISKNILKPQPRHFQLEYQIPVAVVYDEPLEITNKKLKTYREQLKICNTRRRRPNSTTDPTTVEVKTVEDDVQEQPSKNEVKQNVTGKQRLKQTQNKSSANENLPIAIQVTENKNKESQTKLTQEKAKISRSEVKQNIRGRQRYKQIQDTYVPIVNIPVVVQVTENEAEEPKKKYAQDTPATSRSEVKQNIRGRQRVKPTQDTSTWSIPVVVKFTENREKEPLTKFAQDKTSTGKSEVRQNVRGNQQVKHTQDRSSVEENIPVVVQFTENKNHDTSTNRSQDKPSTSKSEVKQETLSTMENVPVVVQFTENKDIQTSHTHDKTRIRKPAKPDDSNAKELITDRSQPKSSLQTQNRDSSFKAQQKEEKRQDSESAKKRERDPVVPIVKSDNHAYGNSGSFSYSYESGDGTKAFETGELKKFEDDKTGAAVVGGFSYKDKDGTDYSLSYTADENGYRPIGDHLPTPPPIPVAIQRALDYLATKTTPAPVTEAGEA